MESSPNWSSLSPENWSDEKQREYEASWKKPIESLVYPMLTILEELRPNIESGSYKVILGEDASGRIPTLMMREVINELYERKGFERPLVRFVAGSRYLDEADPTAAENKRTQLLEHITKMGKEAGIQLGGSKNGATKNEKILIVTETITTGSSMRALLEAVHGAGFDADIATITVDKGEEGKSRTEFDGAFVTYGGTGTAPIWGEYELGGVKKRNTDLFAETYGDPKTAALARHAVKLFSQVIVERFLEKKDVQQFKDAA